MKNLLFSLEIETEPFLKSHGYLNNLKVVQRIHKIPFSTVSWLSCSGLLKCYICLKENKDKANIEREREHRMDVDAQCRWTRNQCDSSNTGSWWLLVITSNHLLAFSYHLFFSIFFFLSIGCCSFYVSIVYIYYLILCYLLI